MVSRAWDERYASAPELVWTAEPNRFVVEEVAGLPPGSAAVTAAAVAGSLLGGRLAGRIPEDVLPKAFGWFVVVMGLFVLAQQLPDGLRSNPLLWMFAGVAAAVLVLTMLVRRGKRAGRHADQGVMVTSRR